MAGAVFGDLAVSLFVAGAVLGEIWVDSRIVKCCNFQYKMRCRGGKVSSANGRAQFCNFMVGSWSDHARIGRTLDLTLQLFSANFSYILECNFAWQAQYLVRLEGDARCSPHCK